MNKQEALDYFGGSARELAYAFEPPISVPALKDWGDKVPPLRQLQLEAMTAGVLKADPAILPDYTIVKKTTTAGMVRFMRVPK